LVVSDDKKKQLFHSMLRIRMVQERIESEYLNDDMKTPIHLCIGQEAVASGVCGALETDDFISSNHRGHGHYLAKGGNLNAMIAELYCKSNGCSKGFGGSMHLVDTSVGHLGSSSIVGGGIPIGTGLGLSIQMKKTNGVSVVFFGDGASDEGTLYESINFAMLKKLPVVYILENNQWSVCSRISARQSTGNIFHSVPPDKLWTQKLDGNDVFEVYEAAWKAVERARDMRGPSFIECVTYRLLGHAGCASQDAKGYRDQEEIERWRKRCPLERAMQQLLSEAVLCEEDIASMTKKIEKEIDESFEYAMAGALPGRDDLYKYLFSE
jgi:pyruvate dehydrogenase E1 component alpha subunit